MASRKIRGKAFVGGMLRDDVTISIDDGKISDVQPGVDRRSEKREDSTIIPGLVDLHVHGAAGADFMDASVEGVEAITRFHARHGTTALAATTLSGSHEHISAAIDSIVNAQAHAAMTRGSEIVAIHLEGPFIQPRKAGAQDPASIRPGSAHEVESWLSRAPLLAWMMTVAPEVDGVPHLIEELSDRILFSIGHTDATYAQALDAVKLGARHFTHLFNAMAPLHHREPGPVGAALVSEDTTGEIIADGIHVHPLVLRTMTTLMPHRLMLVTDAMRACGMPAGTYKLYEHDVVVRNGEARLKDGTLAGSTLTMICALQNMVELAGVPIEQAIPLATEIPARAIGLQRRKGKIEIGFDADLLVISPKFEITSVIVGGNELELA